MPDLDEQTLFGQESRAELIPWPAIYGNRPQVEERTLFGQEAIWGSKPWPEGYGSTP